MSFNNYRVCLECYGVCKTPDIFIDRDPSYICENCGVKKKDNSIMFIGSVEHRDWPPAIWWKPSTWTTHVTAGPAYWMIRIDHRVIAFDTLEEFVRRYHNESI